MSLNKTEIKKKILELLKEEETDYSAILRFSKDLSKLDEKYQRFFVDAKTLIHLGRDSIKDHTTALLELIKNSYDADATNVDIEVLCKNGNDTIRVSDNGFGMTKDQLINGWLQIGYSDKRKSKVSKIGRRKTGEKGIGRISTDRLGSKLQLITKSKADGIIGLKVSWDKFDVEGKDISDINIELIHPKDINVPEKNGTSTVTGTEIIISGLRQAWTPQNIENLYYELSALTPPFNEIEDFAIILNNDVAPSYSKKIDSDFFKASEIELVASYDGKGSDILYQIKDKYSGKEKTELVDWQNLLTKTVGIDEIDLSENLRCGPVVLKLLFFLRAASSVRDTDFKLAELREFLDNNAGIKIYRDNIAVKPYGFASSQFGYDWLGLAERKAKDPAGISRGGKSYKVTPNQLVGAVFISRDSNLDLSDSAAREGLVESEAFYDLRNFVVASINMLESYRADMFAADKKNKENKESSSSQEAEQIKSQLSYVREELESIKDSINAETSSTSKSTLSRPLEKSIEQVEEISEKVDRTISDLISWNRVLGGLATIGISAAVFGHETENSISQFRTSADNARKLIAKTSPDIKTAIAELEKALKHSKKVATWGAYALTRVQKERRVKKTLNIRTHIIDAIVKELRPAFEASSINLEVTGKGVYTKTYQIDIESILINLLTNAYTASSQKAGLRKVIINIDKDDKKDKEGYLLTVSDTGPGIAKEFQNRIYDPLFSTKSTSSNSSKSVGTGLGLTIVRSTVTDLNGEISFDRDPKLKGARFKVWLPKEG